MLALLLSLVLQAAPPPGPALAQLPPQLRDSAATRLREISQCPQNGPTRAFSFHVVEQVVGWRYFWDYLLHGSVFC